MPIEFRCPSCDQQLRVPDAAAGKNAKCPKCATILAVPASSSAASPTAPLGPPPQPGFNFGPPAPAPAPGGAFGSLPPSNPFGAPASPFGEPKQPQGANPFGYQPAPGTATVNPNPYASPQGGYHVQHVASGGPINPQIVEIGPILSYSLKVWQANLGLLVGMTLFPAAVILPLFAVMFGFVAVADQADAEILIPLAVIAFYVAVIFLSVYLGIGQSQLCLKLCRGEPAAFKDMFPTMERFWPCLGFMLLWNLMIMAAALAFIVPAIILAFLLWPAQQLVVDGKCRVMESFGMAYRLTQGNHLTTFLLILVGMGFSSLGAMACYIGLIFAIPLILVMWNVAYLMMSGQLAVPQPVQYGGQQYGGPQQPVYR
jgi:hypothetical protein